MEELINTPIPNSTPSKDKIFKVTLIIIGLLIVVGLFLNAYLVLKKSNRPFPTGFPVSLPTPIIPSPTSVPDVTAIWKTYTNTQYKYSVKYPADYSVVETSSDYVRFFPGINNPNLPQGQTYLSIQLDKSSQQLPEAVYKKTADGKTLRITQILMDVDENQKPQIKAIFDQILSTFKFLP